LLKIIANSVSNKTIEESLEELRKITLETAQIGEKLLKPYGVNVDE